MIFEKGFKLKLGINDLTGDVFMDLYTSVGWEPPCIE